MTIEELASRSGMTVRNIRSHRARGLLPAPEVRERIGYYGQDHLDRLRVIRELQAEGLNLQGIKLLLDQAGDSSGRLLDLKATLATPFETEQPQVFTLEELAERFGGQVDPAILKQAEEFGTLVPLGEDRWEAPAPSLIEIAAEVAAQGVPLEHALAVGRKVNERCEAIARDFVRLYLEDLWKPFADAGYPAERWDQIVGSIERLRPLSSKAVLASYQLTMSREVESAFGKELRRRVRRKR